MSSCQAGGGREDVPSETGEVVHLATDDDTLAAGSAGNVLVLRGRAALLIGVSAAGSTTIELDAVTRAGDTVTFTRTIGAVGSDGRRRGRIGAGRKTGASGGRWLGVVLFIIFDGGLGKAGGDITNGGSVDGTVFGLEDELGSVWGDWLWGHDLGDGKWATLWDIIGDGSLAAGLTAGGRRVLGAGGGLGGLGRG